MTPLTTAPNNQALRRCEEQAASAQHDIGGLPCPKDTLPNEIVNLPPVLKQSFKGL